MFIHLVMPEKYILLEDTIAYKQTANIWNLILGGRSLYTEEHLLRGSLLLEQTENEAMEAGQYFNVPLNYKKYSDNSVKLYCTPEQVLWLNEK